MFNPEAAGDCAAPTRERKRRSDQALATAETAKRRNFVAFRRPYVVEKAVAQQVLDLMRASVAAAAASTRGEGRPSSRVGYLRPAAAATAAAAV